MSKKWGVYAKVTFNLRTTKRSANQIYRVSSKRRLARHLCLSESGDTLREKFANFPLLLIRRALQFFALAAPDKDAKLHSEKAYTRTKRNVSSRHFRGSFPALSRRSSQSKGAVRGCAKSRIKSWGEMLNISHFFSFSPRLFPTTTPFINRFLEEETPNTYDNSANTLTRETAPVRHSYAKQTTARPVDAGFAHSRPPNLRVSPHPPSVSFVHKKTATHLPMDSCLKECGR